jgi:co-chaperonin GroES (HSP10)
MLNDRIAVREIPRPQVSAGGIFVGEHRDDGLVKETLAGEVVAVGPGLPEGNGMWGIEPGHTVMFSPVMAAKHVIDGVELTIIRRDSVVGVMQ